MPAMYIWLSRLEVLGKCSVRLLMMGTSSVSFRVIPTSYTEQPLALDTHFVITIVKWTN